MESTGPENPNPTPPEEPRSEPPPRLMRSRTDRVIGGVAGGLARYLNIDATVVRIGFVAGILLWGTSILLYIAALFLMPEEPADGAPDATARPAVQLPSFEGRNRTLAAIGVVVLILILGPIALGLTLAAGLLALPLALLVVTALGVAWAVTGRKPESDPGSIARLTVLGLGILTLLFVLFVGAFWAAAAGGDGVIAGLVIAAGVVLVVSAFARPARGLILPALVVAISAGFVAAADVDLDGGVGEKRYHPRSAADVRSQYEIGAGDLRVDLRDVDLPAGERHVRVDVGMGHAIVLVPDDVCVSTTADLGMGHVHAFDREGSGVDVDWENLESPAPGNAHLVLDAEVGFGALEVRRDDAGFRRWRGRDDEPNEACLA